MENKDYSKEDIVKLIGLAYKNIKRIKGENHSPDVHELQNWINKYISKEDNTIKKKDTSESMGADASGSFETTFSAQPIKRKITKIHNLKEESDLDESTVADSSGAYDAPFGDGGKNPLKIGGEASIKKSRAVKDKNFPKWGGPKGIYVKVKDKCKKYPYCNQGDINALEFFESKQLKETIESVSKKTGIPYLEIEKLVINEINKIFIK